MKIGDWQFIPESDELVSEFQTIKLEAQCAQVLKFLCLHAGEVVSRDALLDGVWGKQSISVQSVAVVISKLRTLLGDDPQQPRYIQTLHKRGYRLISTVVSETKEDEALLLHAEKLGLGSSTSRKILISVGFVIAVIIAAYSYWRSTADTPLLYVADVENLTYDSAYDATAAASSDLLTSAIASSNNISVVRLRRSQGDNGYTSPALNDANAQPTPLLTSSIIWADEGARVVMQIEDSQKQIMWTHSFNITPASFAQPYTTAANIISGLFGDDNPQSQNITYSPIEGVEEIYLKANYHWGLRGRDNNLLALTLANDALALDSNYAPAIALLAEIYTRYDASYLDLDGVDTVAMAHEYLNRAENIAPQNPLVQLAAATQKITLDWRPDLALDILKNIPTQDPLSGMMLRVRASAHYLLGDFEANARDLTRAMSLELGSPFIKLEQILSLFAEEKYSEVITVAEQIPSNFYGTYNLYIGMSYQELGMIDKAFDIWAYYLEDKPIPEDPAKNPFILARNGQIEEAYRALIPIVEATYEGKGQKILRAIFSVYAGLEGEAPRIMASIPFSRNSNFLNAIHLWPVFYAYRNDPTMQTLLKDIGVAPLARCIHQACKNSSM